MTEQSQSYNLRTLRQLLIAAFDTEELRALVMYDDNLDGLAVEFAPTHPITTMVDETISWCKRRVLIPYLVQLVKEANPRAYERFEPDLLIAAAQQPREEATAEPTPEILTITSPIYLDLVRIPAGEFWMGSVAARDQHAEENEFPPHRVGVPEFDIGLYPVTNLQYQAFVKAKGARAPETWESDKTPPGKGNHPVVGISWNEAVSFCTWLGKETRQPFRLPTEAEWEKAARGADGRIWPWGDAPPDESRCNFDGHVDDTTLLGRYSPQGDSFYGCADMAGNVWEWCHSWFRPYPYRAGDGREMVGGRAGDLDRSKVALLLAAIHGPGACRVLRGGSWAVGPARVRCAFRNYGIPAVVVIDSGFRVARGPLKGAP